MLPAQMIFWRGKKNDQRPCSFNVQISQKAPQAGCKEGVAIRRVIKIKMRIINRVSGRRQHEPNIPRNGRSSRKEDKVYTVEYTTQAWAVVPPGKTALVVWKV